jgi:hypothetical protein
MEESLRARSIQWKRVGQPRWNASLPMPISICARGGRCPFVLFMHACHRREVYARITGSALHDRRTHRAGIASSTRIGALSFDHYVKKVQNLRRFFYEHAGASRLHGNDKPSPVVNHRSPFTVHRSPFTVH